MGTLPPPVTPLHFLDHVTSIHWSCHVNKFMTFGFLGYYCCSYKLFPKPPEFKGHRLACNTNSLWFSLCKLKGGYMPILTCIFVTFNWLTMTSEMQFVKFHPQVASCLLSRGKRKYAPLGMRLWWKYIRNYFLVYQLTSHFLSYLQNYKEFEAEILDLQLEKYGQDFIWYQKMYYFLLSPRGWECDWHKVL